VLLETGRGNRRSQRFGEKGVEQITARGHAAMDRAMAVRHES
jgi:hypothetical protein